MIGERIGERASLDAHGRMNEQSGWLDDYDQMLVFVQDFERQDVRLHRRRPGFIESYLYKIACCDAPTSLRRYSINRANARADEIGYAHARQAAESRFKEFIETAARVFFRDLELERLTH
jgi:hypothetical protein